MNKSASLFFALIAITFSLNAQLDSLYFELFDKNQEVVNLSKISCPNNKIDSTIKIRSKQPIPEKVFKYLKFIQYENNSLKIAPLKEIYFKHVDNFELEWGQLYKQNFYHCDIVDEQFDILIGFERVLSSLTIKKEKLNPKQIFELYKSDRLLDQKYFKNINKRDSLLFEYKVFSEKYRDFHKKAWFSGSPRVTKFGPYIHLIEPFFIELVEACDWDLGVNHEKNKFIWRNKSFINQFKSKGITNYFINNFELLRKNGLHFIAFEYAKNQTSKELARFLIKIILSDYYSFEGMSDNAIINFFLKLKVNKNNEEILIEELLIELQKNNPIAIQLLHWFPYENIIKNLKRQKRRLRTKKKTKQEINKSLAIILQKLAKKS